MKFDSARELFDVGGDDLVSDIVMHYTADGGLEIVQWLVENFENTILDKESALGHNVLVDAILSDHIDIVEWLMDSCNLTTHGKSPLYYAVEYGDPTLSTGHWFLNRLSTTDIQSELIKAIKKSEWVVATFVIEHSKVNIDEKYLWKTIDWTDMAKNESEDPKLFLRALLPRVDFPSDVSDVLMNTLSSRRENGTEIYLHRQMVLNGVVVRKKVKKLDESRAQIVKNLDLPDDLIYDVMNDYLGNNHGISTERMWNSRRY
jgi:hypothetical protein